MTTPPDGAAERPGNSSRSVRFRTEIGLTRPEPSDRSDAGEPVEHWDALVVGGGIAGLTAAWELARAGVWTLTALIAVVLPVMLVTSSTWRQSVASRLRNLGMR